MNIGKNKLSFHHFALISIFLFALFWRFANYSNRWVLNQDQARDVTITLYGLRNHTLPLLGSPSSAGPFNFGALYFWLLALVTFIFPFISGPWVAFTLISAAAVFVFYCLGLLLGDRKLALLLAALWAFASGSVAISTDMLNTVIVAPAVALALLFTIAYLQTQRLRYAFFQAFCIGLAQNFHFQSLGLFSLLLATFLLQSGSFKKRLSYAIIAAFGWSVSFVPNFYFDVTHHFVWSQSVITYYTGGVNKFYVPVRWLTELRDFWPQLWGQVTTGFPFFGYFLIPVFIFSLLSRPKRSLVVIILSFLFQVLLLRYYKGVRSSEYFIFLYPYIVLFVGYTCWSLINRFFFPGLIFTLVVFIFASLSNIQSINKLSQAPAIFTLKQALDRITPGSVDLYSYPASNMASLPIFYLLYQENRISSTGTPLVVAINATQSAIYTLPARKDNSYQLLDPSKVTIKVDRFTPSKIFNWVYVNY